MEKFNLIYQRDCSEEILSNYELSPFVYWAQTEQDITLKVELRNVKSHQIQIEEDQLRFVAVGFGAQEETNYGFNLDFNKNINAKESRYRVTEGHVYFNLRKQFLGFWPRLLSNPQKPAWLKIDFDKWQHEEDLEDEAGDIMDDYPGIYDNLRAQELGWAAKRESLKKVYLFMYNLWQFIGFFYIVVVTLTRYSKDGEEAMAGTYNSVSWMLKLCFMTQIFEIFHPLLGYTKGSVFEPLLQITGRGLIFFCLIASEERMQTKPVVFYLILVWSAIEVIRYPYYLLRTYDLDFGLLTWLRYTVWIPLYPLGFVLEGTVILRSIPYAEETQLFSIALPNAFNVAFDFATALRCYLVFFFFPVMYKMLSHMHALRKTKLGNKKRKKA